MPDPIDAPLGESRELYRVELEGPAGSVEIETSTAAYVFGSGELASVGTGDAILWIRQLGDLAASRPASLSITLT